ncbi:MAG: M23 family metallopeptidase [Bacteroidales bacterium]|jgi:murein DD-endopeptidase MepM/ murein hydrolase activator NlpD
MVSCLKRIPVLVTALGFVFLSLGAQEKDLAGYYVSPIAINPLTLSGSMGEFRATHFHTGYDFRVGGVSGTPVYAVAQGYISRITVSPGGYGNALQITHPNGTVSLYGHLESFAPDIASYVEEEQYAGQQFSVALDCPPEMFPVHKGQQIGRAGNSGDSAGPHLHFEIRYRDSLLSSSYFTANLIRHGVYEIEDTLPPEFRAIQFYGYNTDPDGIAQTRLTAGFTGNGNHLAVNVADTFFVAVDAIDRMNNTWSRMGIEKWEVFLDTTLVYRYTNGDLPLEYTRNILSLVYYPERAINGKSLLKTWVEPGNVMADNRIEAPTRGLFSLKDTLDHTLSIVIHDGAGNRAKRSFTVRKKSGLDILVTDRAQMDDLSQTQCLQDEYQQRFFWDATNVLSTRDINVKIQEKALYKDIMFRAIRVDSLEWCLHTAEEPLHLPMQVQWQVPASVPDSLYDKVVVLRQSDKGRDPHMVEADPRLWRSVGGICRDSTVSFQSNAFGRYRIDVDTIPPTVSASFGKGADLRGRRSVYFTIKDECSGIRSYNLTIDGKWVLGIHDGKRSRVTCVLDAKRIAKGTKHRLTLQVVDQKNNSTEFNTEFLW